MRIIRSIALVAVIALTLGACASDDDGGGVASLGGNGASGATGTTGAASPEDAEEAIQAFAECMRDNGVEDFPDPQIDEDGGISIGLPAGGDGEETFDRETLDAAMEACEGLLPESVGPGSGEGPSAEELAALEDTLLEYAQCMRDHGIDFPDPEISADGGLVQIGPGDGADPDDPDFQAADEACQPILEEAFSEAGRGGGTVDVAD